MITDGVRHRRSPAGLTGQDYIRYDAVEMSIRMSVSRRGKMIVSAVGLEQRLAGEIEADHCRDPDVEGTVARRRRSLS